MAASSRTPSRTPIASTTYFRCEAYGPDVPHSMPSARPSRTSMAPIRVPLRRISAAA